MARKPKSPYRLDPAIPADLDQIMEIERSSFSSPWSRQVFVEEFDRSFSFLVVLRDDGSAHQASRTGRVLAFINYWVVHDEIHVLNIATHPDARRRGLARRLLNHAIQTGLSCCASLVTLEVRRSNTAAAEMYKGFGFEAAGVRKRYYEDGEDAIVMVLDLDTTV